MSVDVLSSLTSSENALLQLRADEKRKRSGGMNIERSGIKQSILGTIEKAFWPKRKERTESDSDTQKYMAGQMAVCHVSSGVCVLCGIQVYSHAGNHHCL